MFTAPCPYDILIYITLYTGFGPGKVVENIGSVYR